MKKFCLLLSLFRWSVGDRDLTQEPGHLKPFGSGRPIQILDEIDGFPDPRSFFQNYVLPLKPVKMKGAAKMSPAFHRWTDEYFLSMDIPSNISQEVVVEMKKKENRSEPTVLMDFKDFVRTYNNSDIYMVQNLPVFLQQDVVVPCPLQCMLLLKIPFLEMIMWYSSGGTQSVVHTDSYENMNCLFRGEKELIFVDPSKYKDKVDIDRPYGAFSAVDVERVDYTKYPGLADVEYIQVNLTAGDCLYIPHKWIHQVRSYGSNIAVNLWWMRAGSKILEPDKCDNICNESLSLSQDMFQEETENADTDSVRDLIFDLLDNRKPLDFPTFMESVLTPEEFVLINSEDDFVKFFKQMFSTFDVNNNNIISEEEVLNMKKEDWEKLADMTSEITSILENLSAMKSGKQFLPEKDSNDAKMQRDEL